MQFRAFMGIVCLTATAAFSAGTLSAEPASPICACASLTIERNYPQEASRLLQEVQSAAARLTSHADNLESVMRGGSSWQSHASELTQAREHINFICRQLQLLQEIRSEATPAQQEAIDSIVPIASTTATHAEAAIQHLNDSPRYLWADSYRSRVMGLSESAERMRKSVGLHLEIEEVQTRLDSLLEEAASL